MSSLSQSDNEKLLHLIGAIVLTCQDVERHLKITLPFLNSDDPNLGAALKRLEKLKKRTLGELVGKLIDSSTSESLDFAQHLNNLVVSRNQIVHHFNETYGSQINAGAYQDVIVSLQVILANLNGLRFELQQLALFVCEGLRDVTFYNTPEYEEMATLCAYFRQRVEIPNIKTSNAKTPDDRLTAIIANLRQRGASKPRTVMTLTSTINSLFQKSLTETELQSLLEQLHKKGMISIAGTKVSYALSE